MKALSIRQPWAWLIVKGHKDIENRNWSTKMRGRIYVHASLSQADMSKQVLAWILARLNNRDAAEFMLDYPQLPFGVILGEVDIVGCVTESESPWFAGPFGFVLRNPMLYEKAIPCRGRLGLFEPEIEPCLPGGGFGRRQDGGNEG